MCFDSIAVVLVGGRIEDEKELSHSRGEGEDDEQQQNVIYRFLDLFRPMLE